MAEYPVWKTWGRLNIVDLVKILALEAVDTATFEGRSGPAMGPRLFGGHAIAQALPIS